MNFQALLDLQQQVELEFARRQAAGEIHPSYGVVGFFVDARGVHAVGESADGNVAQPGYATARFLVIPA